MVGRAVGSQIDFRGWVPTAFSVVVNGVGAVGLIDFTGGAMVPPPGGCRIQTALAVGDLERFDNLAVDAVVT